MIKFGNFWDKTFWSWEMCWEDENGARTTECNTHTVWQITTTYFWFFSIETKEEYKLIT